MASHSDKCCVNIIFTIMINIYYLGIPIVFLFGFFYGLFAGLVTGFRLASDRLAVVIASRKNFPSFYDQSFSAPPAQQSIADKRAPLFSIDFLATILICFPLIIFLTMRGIILGPMCLTHGYVKKIRSLS